MTRVKEHAEKWAAQKGIIVTESQMIRELQAENKALRGEEPIPYAWWADCPALAQRTMERIIGKNDELQSEIADMKEKIKQIHDIVSGSFSDSKTVSMIYEITKA